MPSHNIKRTKKKIQSISGSKKTLKNININKIQNYNNSEEKKKSSKVGGNLDNIKLFLKRSFPGLDAIIDKVPKNIDEPNGDKMLEADVIDELLKLRTMFKNETVVDLQDCGLLEESDEKNLEFKKIGGGDGDGGDTQDSILNNQSCDFVVNIKKLDNLEEIYGRGLYYIYRLETKNNNKNILGLEHDTLYDKNSFFTRFCQSITHQEHKDQLGNAQYGRYFCIHKVLTGILDTAGSVTNPAKMVAFGMSIIHWHLEQKEDKRKLISSYQEAQRKMIKILYLCFAIDCKIFKLYKSRHTQELDVQGQGEIRNETVKQLKSITRRSTILGGGPEDKDVNHKKYDQRKKEGILYLPPPLDKKFILSQFLSVISTGHLGDFVSNILNGDIYNYLLLQYVQFDTLVDTIRDAPPLQPGEFKLFTYDIYFDVLNIQHEICILEKIELKVAKHKREKKEESEKDYFEKPVIEELSADQINKKQISFGDDKYFMKPNKYGYSQINFTYWLTFTCPDLKHKIMHHKHQNKKKIYIEKKIKAYKDVLLNYEKYIIINDIKYIKYALSKYMYNARNQTLENSRAKPPPNIRSDANLMRNFVRQATFGYLEGELQQRDIFKDIVEYITGKYIGKKVINQDNTEDFKTNLENHLLQYLDNYFCRLITMSEMRYHFQIIKNEKRENIKKLSKDDSRRYVDNFCNYLKDNLGKDPTKITKGFETREQKTDRKIYQSQHKYGIPLYSIFRDNLMFYFLGIEDSEITISIENNNKVSFALFTNLFINYMARRFGIKPKGCELAGLLEGNARVENPDNNYNTYLDYEKYRNEMADFVAKYIHELGSPETLLHIQKEDGDGDKKYNITRSHDPIGNQTLEVINESESSNESKKFNYLTTNGGPQIIITEL